MTALGLPRASVLRYMIRVPVATMAPSCPDGSSTSRDGSVRMFDCTACTGVNGLVKLARARLHEIVHAKR